MNKKKILILSLVLILVLSLALAFCGKQEPVSNVAPPTEAATTALTEATAEASPEAATDAAQATEAPTEEPIPTTPDGKVDTEKYLDQNANVGVGEGGGTQDLEGGSGSAPAPVPQETTPAVEDSDNNKEPVTLDIDIYAITYDVYMAMSAEEQKAVMEFFGSTEDFMNWLNFIKEQYAAEHPNIEIGPDGSVNLG